MTTNLANVEQARAWDGTEGTQWTLREERYEESTAAHAVHLLRAAAIGPDDQVLDVGCGCGSTTREVATRALQGLALGVDLSEKMLTRARERATIQGLRNIEFLQADAQVHPFDAEFDVVISKYGAMFFADPVAAFANLAGATRADGRLTLLAWAGLGANAWVSQIRTALAAGRVLPEPPANAPGPFGLAEPDHARRVLDEAGWRGVRVTEIAEPVRLGDDPDHAFAFVSQMSITLGLLDGLDTNARDASLERLHETMREAMTHVGVFLPSTSWLIEARRS
jgi:SAM-dependent methyltransferase